MQYFLLTKGGAAVERGTCNPKIVGSSPPLSKVPSFTCSKNCDPRQGRVRQLALRATLESVGGSDNERVAWSLYKCEVPPVCIPRATGDKGVKRISLHTLGTRDRATTCHKQEDGAFSRFTQRFLGSFTFHLKDSSLDVSITHLGRSYGRTLIYSTAMY